MEIINKISTASEKFRNMDQGWENAKVNPIR